jgi:hypothetical protein
MCEMWKSLEDIYAQQTDVAVSHTLHELNMTYLAPGAPVLEHAAIMPRSDSQRYLRQALGGGLGIHIKRIRSTNVHIMMYNIWPQEAVHMYHCRVLQLCDFVVVLL